MCELHPGRLREVEVQFLLKMLIHHVDHAVAKSPEREKKDEQGKGE